MLNVAGAKKGMDMRSSLAAFRATLGKGGEGAEDDPSDEEDAGGEDQHQGKKHATKRASHVPAAGIAPKSKPPAAGVSTAAKPAAASAAASSSPAGQQPNKVQVKVVVKGVKSLPATSVAGIQAQQAALAAAEEKTNSSMPNARGGAPVGARVGTRISQAAPAVSSSGMSGVSGGASSCIPASLPKTANLLQFIPTEQLRALGATDVQRLFDFYVGSSGGGGSTAANGEKHLSRSDLQRLCTDLLERVRRVLAEEVRRQGVSASSDVATAVERELGFLVRGKSDEEKKTSLMLIMLNKAHSKTATISKNAFIHVWGALAAELFTVKTEEALGCVIS